MKTGVPILLSLLSLPAFGCFAPPPEQASPPDELIERTQDIVLAEVIGAERPPGAQEVTYTFRTIRVLKGGTSGEFRITGHPVTWDDSNRNFNHHLDEAFWSRRGGRTPHGTDCQIHPDFSVGGTYLVFLDRPYHAKSFEAIPRAHGDPGSRDKWLQYVESRLGAH